MKNIVLILFAIILFLPNSQAQTSFPGGISPDLTLWLDGTDGANIGTISAINGGSVDNWVNRKTNPGCIDLNQINATKMPIYRTNALNYNPIVEFDGANDQLDRSVLGSDLFDANNNTIFLVHKHYGGGVYFKWEQGSSGNRVGFEDVGTPRFDFPSDAAGNQTIGTFPFNPIGQIVTATTNNSVSTLRDMGLQNIVNPTTGALNTSFTSDLSIGENVQFSLPSQIDFAEIIIYNGALSLIEMNRVESYLAIKYGMTLGINGTSLNYNSSGGNTIWDATANAGYNFDIAGVSRDDLSDQSQLKSKSINQILGIDRDILTIANSTNLAVPINFGSDMSHLVWGNNGSTTTMNNLPAFSTANGNIINVVLDKHWKSQETGTVGIATLYFELANVTGFTNWSDLKLLIDDDGIFTTGATSFTPSFIDSTGVLTIEFEHDFSATEGFYFTLAASSILRIDNPPVIDVCDSYTLLPITGENLINAQYYSDTTGTGSIIPVGTVITTDSIIYLYDETGSTPNQFDQDTLDITINPNSIATTPLDSSYCAGVAVPASAYTSLPIGATYEWLHTNTAVGLTPLTGSTATANPNTPGFTATNTTLLPDTTIVSVIPTLNTCTGDTVDYFIIVNPNLTPTFTQLGPYCVNDAPAALPTTSTSGATGTWNAAISTVINGTTTYTFTPSSGCFTAATMDVVVVPNIVPTFIQLGPYCVNDAPATLPTTSTNGATGTWNTAISTVINGTITYTFTPSSGCFTAATMDIVVVPNIVPTFIQLGPYCVNEIPDILPTTSTNGITGTWNTTISTVVNGTITYTFTPPSGCFTAATMDVVVSPNLVPTFTPVDPICIGDPLTPLRATSNNAVTGTWAPALDSTTTTTYTFTPTIALCNATVTLTIIVRTPPIIIDRVITPPSCFGSTNGKITLTPFGGTPSYTYSWTTGDTGSVASNLSPGPVTVTVTDTYNCFQDSTFNIVEPDSIDYISFYATPREGCSPLEVQFNCSIDPAQHLLKNYVWDFGNNLVPQDTFIAQSTYVDPRTYDVSLTVTDFSECSNTLTLNNFITVFEDPEAHFSTSPEAPTMLNPTIDFSDASYPNIAAWEWQFDTLGISNYESPRFTFPEDSGNYYVTLIVEDENSCRDTLSRIVSIRSEIALFLPTSFTPNGDGINDTFAPKGFGLSTENYSFLIFNRWGEVVFETNNILDGWDGSFKGKLLPTGVYAWRADFTDLNGKDFRRKGQMNILP